MAHHEILLPRKIRSASAASVAKALPLVYCRSSRSQHAERFGSRPKPGPHVGSSARTSESFMSSVMRRRNGLIVWSVMGGSCLG